MSLQQRECGIHALYGEPGLGRRADLRHSPAHQQRDGGQPNGTAATAAAGPSRNPVTMGNGQAASAPGGIGAWRDRGEPLRRR